MKVVRLSAQRTGHLYFQGSFLLFISVRGWVDPRAIMRPEGLSQWKISNTPLGMNPRPCGLQLSATAYPRFSMVVHVICRVVSTELVSCHHSGVSNVQVVPRCLQILAPLTYCFLIRRCVTFALDWRLSAFRLAEWSPISTVFVSSGCCESVPCAVQQTCSSRSSSFRSRTQQKS
jgi:hypothetical protein